MPVRTLHTRTQENSSLPYPGQSDRAGFINTKFYLITILKDGDGQRANEKDEEKKRKE